MDLRKGQIIPVKIEKLAFGGSGLGYFEYNDRKMVVFVENTVPGDEITASLTKIKQNYLEAKLVEIVKESDLRIKPRCKHFDICGGCTLQNLPYQDQIKIKESQVTEALEHIGDFKNVSIKPIIGCKDEWFYRNKMEFSFDKNDDGEITVGLHPKHYRYEVFELSECFLESEDTGGLVQKVQEFARKNNIEPYNFKKNSGLLRALVIREGKRTGERLVNLITSAEEFDHEKEFVEIFKDASSVYLTKQIVEKGRKTRFEHKLLKGKKVLNEKMKLENGTELNFEILPDAFFQPNTYQAEVLYETVLNEGEISEKDTVFDLFCGTGTIGLFCAHKAKQVLGVDINKNAIESAKQNAKANKINNIKFKEGNVFKIIEDEETKPDIVIVDPPRAGLGEKLCLHLNEISAPKIVYVSCNPTTMARDLKILCEEKYRLESVQPVDMLPHTYHIETVCKLSLR